MEKKELKDRLKKAMEIRNLKQADLVEKYNFDKGQLSSWLSGKYKPRQNNISKLATALSVDEAWLMGYDVPMNSNENRHILENKFDMEKIERAIAKANNSAISDGSKLDNDKLKDILVKIVDEFCESHAGESVYFDILENTQKLNAEGKVEARKRVSELTEIPKYIDTPTEKLNHFTNVEDAKLFLSKHNIAAFNGGKKLSNEAIIQMANIIKREKNR